MSDRSGSLQAKRVRLGFVLSTTAALTAAGLVAFIVIAYLAVVWAAPDQKHLSHYAAADRALGATGSRDKVVFIGDSITQIWPTRAPATWDASWVNRGIGGERSEQVRARFAQDVLALHPQAVVILVGTNDAVANSPALPLAMTEANIAAMTTLARAAGVRVLLASVPPLGWRAYPLIPANAEKRIGAQNAWMREYAARSGAGFVDYWRVMRPDLTSDGVHPSAAGYAVMAREAKRALAS